MYSPASLLSLLPIAFVVPTPRSPDPIAQVSFRPSRMQPPPLELMKYNAVVGIGRLLENCGQILNLNHI